MPKGPLPPGTLAGPGMLRYAMRDRLMLLHSTTEDAALVIVEAIFGVLTEFHPVWHMDQ